MKFRFNSKRKKKIISFNNVLPEIINDFGFEDSFIIEKIKVNWPKIVGDIFSSHSIPNRIFKKTLFIYVDHSTYANEIIMMKDVIINNVNEKASSNIIINIRTEIKRLKWKKNK